MKRIGILVPDGVGVKNYLYSKVLRHLLDSNVEVVLLHNLSNKALAEIKSVYNFEFKNERLPQYKETLIGKFLRELICLSRLKYNVGITNNETLYKNWNPSKTIISKKIFYFIIDFLSFFFSKNYSRIIWLESMLQKSINTKKVSYLFEKGFDVIFSTHQRSLLAMPIVKKARDLKIRTVGAIYSWDNLPKARLSVRTDEYLVWSKYMKHEMKRYYSEILPSNIYITGTPQFEFYNNDELLWSREKFFHKYGLDLNKKTICFSGDDVMTSPFDPNYLKDLAEELNKLPEKNRPQILFRKCPVDLSDRYDKIIQEYSSIIKNVLPLWNYEKETDWSLVYPKYEDVELLVNIAYHTDAVINIGSTMAHDFSLYNKPAIYINYNAIKSENWSVDVIYKFEHFKSMSNRNVVYWLNSKNDILMIIDEALNKKKKLSNKEWFDTIVEFKDTASKRISKNLTTSLCI